MLRLTPINRPLVHVLVVLTLCFALASCGQSDPADSSIDVESFAWSRTSDGAPWGGRAGLQVVELNDALLLLGGRTPRNSTIPGDSDIFSDVWRSDDQGNSWQQTRPSDEVPWPARAYFQAVVKDDTAFVIGGQNFGLEPNPFCALLEQGLKPPPSLGIDPDAPCPEFFPTSDFFNDVWSSSDGVEWQQMTDAAPWVGRAGLSAVAVGDYIYVLGGSRNDDASIIGANGPQREYFNDVWRSTDGTDWQEMTSDAPWSPRAGASVLEYQDALWLFGGEVGFTCEPTPDCEPPYFNDVWRSVDGAIWEQVSANAAWSPRPGHQCEAIGLDIACFGGFGQNGNPTDLWFTRDGQTWTEHAESPWSATDQDAIRYDFASIVVDLDKGPAILTFGGDRETFDFEDPTNYLRIEDDVWRFAAS